MTPNLPESARKGLVYLATPYSHDREHVRRARFYAVNKVAAMLMAQGIHVYSPISHTHPIAEAGDLPKGWDYWEAQDVKFLTHCSCLIVYRQSGWAQSKGVAAECDIAAKLGIPIFWIDSAGEIGVD